MNITSNDADKYRRFQSGVWRKLIIAWAIGLLFGFSFYLALDSLFGLALPGSEIVIYGLATVSKDMEMVILLIELVFISFIPILGAFWLGYGRIRFVLWIPIGVAMFIGLFGAWLTSGRVLDYISYWLWRSNELERQLHALPWAFAIASLLAVSWLGISSQIRDSSREFLIGLGVGVGLASLDGIILLAIVRNESWLTLYDFWIVSPFIWTSAVLFIERATK